MSLQRIPTVATVLLAVSLTAANGADPVKIKTEQLEVRDDPTTGQFAARARHQTEPFLRGRED